MDWFGLYTKLDLSTISNVIWYGLVHQTLHTFMYIYIYLYVWHIIMQIVMTFIFLGCRRNLKPKIKNPLFPLDLNAINIMSFQKSVYYANV